MTTVTSTKTQSLTQPANTAADGKFDASMGLPPSNTTLGSEYFSEYIKTVVATGKTPF